MFLQTEVQAKKAPESLNCTLSYCHLNLSRFELYPTFSATAGISSFTTLNPIVSTPLPVIPHTSLSGGSTPRNWSFPQKTSQKDPGLRVCRDVRCPAKLQKRTLMLPSHLPFTKAPTNDQYSAVGGVLRCQGDYFNIQVPRQTSRLHDVPAYYTESSPLFYRGQVDNL